MGMFGITPALNMHIKEYRVHKGNTPGITPEGENDRKTPDCKIFRHK